MAGRAFRRQLNKPSAPERALDSESSSDDEPPAPSRVNLFALMGDDDVEEASDEVEEGGGEGEGEAEASPAKEEDTEEDGGEEQGVPGGDAAAAAPKVSKKKSKSKKGKGKGGKGGKAGGDGGGAAEEDAAIDAICAALEAGRPVPLQAGAGAAGGGGDKGKGAGGGHILSADPRYLRAEDELRRIFGNRVIKELERGEEGGGGGARGQPRFRGNMPRGMAQHMRPMKKGVLITPKEHWPRWDGGLSMECTGTQGGAQVFTYVMSASYQASQREFEEAQATYNPDSIARMLARHPYHIDALLTMSDVYKQMGEHASSSDLLERCLYALECAWHPWFNPALGTCRVDFSKAVNRPLFISLFRHAAHLSRRGCHRTALECAKLVLSLDPEDPMGALLCIDYYAIRAEQPEYVLRLARDPAFAERSLALLPNFAYTAALAKFYLGSSAGGGKTPAEDIAEMLEEQAAGEALREAVLLHPGLVPKVLEKLNLSQVSGDRRWQAALGSKPLAGAGAGGSRSLEFLYEVVAERTSLLFKPADVLDWLRDGVAAAAATAASPGSSECEDWAAARAEAFPPKEANEYRHLHMPDFSDTMNTLPADEGGGAPVPFGGAVMGGGMGGAAAPAFPVAAAGPGMGFGIGPARQGANVPQLAGAVEDLRGVNPAIAFLRSMLPWVNVGEDGRIEGMEPAEAEQLMGEIRNAMAAGGGGEQLMGGGGGGGGGGRGGGAAAAAVAADVEHPQAGLLEEMMGGEIAEEDLEAMEDAMMQAAIEATRRDI